MSIYVWLLLIVLLAPVLLALSRFLLLRSRGSQIIFRRLPAGDAQHWRHGVLIYRQDKAHFYKLRSLRIGPDIVFDRSHITVQSHRGPTQYEASILPEMRDVIVGIAGDIPFEASMGLHEEMAFTSWVETAPDLRRERLDHKALVKRARRHDSV